MRKHCCSVSSIILHSTTTFQSERRLEDGLLSCCTYPEKDALEGKHRSLAGVTAKGWNCWRSLHLLASDWGLRVRVRHGTGLLLHLGWTI